MTRTLSILLMVVSVLPVSAAESSEPQMLVNLVTCEYSWDQVQNDMQLSYRIGKYIAANFERDVDGRRFVPKQPLRLFGANVTSFDNGFGMTPGFNVSLDGDLDEVKWSLEHDHQLVLDGCENDMCFKQRSKTETFGLLVEAGEIYAGCSYPYVP